MKKKEASRVDDTKISKIVVSTGVGRMRQQNAQFDDKVLPELISEFAAIVGQKPATREAKKSVAGFKVRQGEIVGLVATLRGKRKDDFFTKLSKVVLPRVRDFRGISESHMDVRGNLNIGFKDQAVFPEVNPELSKVTFGLEITFVTNAKNREEAAEFYRRNGIPLVIA